MLSRQIAVVVGRCALVLLAVSAVPSQAMALDLSGRWGIGYEETLTSLGGRQAAALDPVSELAANAVPDVRAGGLAFRWWVGNIGVEAITGLSVRVPDQDPIELGGFLSVGALYNLLRTPKVNLSVGGRLLTGVARSNRADGDAGPWRVGLAVEIPLRVEYAFTEHFAVAAAVGPTISWSGKDAHPLTGATESLDVSLTRGEFSGGLGFTYYFGDDEAFAPLVPETSAP
jgi:hypothetical protein